MTVPLFQVMARDQFLTVRADRKALARVNQLAAHVGSRSRFVWLCIGYADATMTMHELVATGAGRDDARVQTLVRDIDGMIAALTATTPQRATPGGHTGRREDSSLGRAEGVATD